MATIDRIELANVFDVRCNLISDDTPPQLSDQTILQPAATTLHYSTLSVIEQPSAPPSTLQPTQAQEHKSIRAQSTRSLTQIITASTLKLTINFPTAESHYRCSNCQGTYQNLKLKSPIPIHSRKLFFAPENFPCCLHSARGLKISHLVGRYGDCQVRRALIYASPPCQIPRANRKWHTDAAWEIILSRQRDCCNLATRRDHASRAVGRERLDGASSTLRGARGCKTGKVSEVSFTEFWGANRGCLWLGYEYEGHGQNERRMRCTKYHEQRG